MRYLLVVVFVCSLLTGCVAQAPFVVLEPSAPCEEILHPALLNVPFDELAQGQEQTEGWIITQFPTATVQSILTSNEQSIRFGWSEGDKDFGLFFAPALGIEYINQVSKQSPTLGMILDCFGDPQYYTLDTHAPIFPGRTGYLFDIYYTDLGLSFRGSTLEATVAQRYDSTSVMNGDVLIMPVGTIEDMIPNLRSTEEGRQELLSMILEWPKDFTAIVPDE
jgi:hypothetical protein